MQTPAFGFIIFSPTPNQDDVDPLIRDPAVPRGKIRQGFIIMQKFRSNDRFVPPRSGPVWGWLGIIAMMMVAVLWWLGRTPWCKCGSYSPWSWDIYSQHNSQHLIDPYFFSHVLHGFVFFAALWPLRHRLSGRARLASAGCVEAAWEILENTPMIIHRYREATISLDYFGDSIANSVFDLIACLLGYAIASRLRWYYTLAIFVAVELVLLATIRDCLVLNVIMLLYPSQSILEWQSP